MVWFINSANVMHIFIHIPKTGGSSIELALGLMKTTNGFGIHKNKAQQHFTWADYKKKFNRVFDISFKFSVCRNPYDRLISDYYWLPVNAFTNGKTIDEFIDYCESIVKKGKYNDGIYADHSMPQYKYIFNENNKLMVNKLFRFENFREIEEYLKNNFNISEVPKIHACICDEKVKLTDQQKDRVYNIYRKDFELLG